MAKQTKIAPEKIAAAKNRGKSKEEAVELLATDVQSALNRGYSLKELQGVLMEEGVSFLKEKAARKRSIAPLHIESKTENKIAENEVEIIQAIDGNANRNGAENAPESNGKNNVLEAVRNVKTGVKNYEGSAHAIIIKPDTPDGEL